MEANPDGPSNDTGSEMAVDIGFQEILQLTASNNARNSDVTTASSIEKTKAVRIS